MKVVLYRGAAGTSKTMSMVKDGLKYQKLGWEVFTNLSKSPFKSVTSAYILSLSGNSQLRHAVLVIDEIELFFDSREWNKQESKNFGRFLQQVRKRHVVILCTAQFSDLIEKRLRQQINMLVICSYDESNSVSTSVYYDLTSIESGQLSYFKISYYAPPLFNLYDTEELVQ